MRDLEKRFKTYERCLQSDWKKRGTQDKKMTCNRGVVVNLREKCSEVEVEAKNSSIPVALEVRESFTLAPFGLSFFEPFDRLPCLEWLK